MRNRFFSAIVLLAATMSFFLMARAPAVGQGRAATPAPPRQAFKVPRTPTGQPDLQGIWKAEGTAYADLQNHGGSYQILPGLGVVEGDEIPYQTWALAKKKENFQNREMADPLGKCFMAGMPRTMYLPYPFQILQTPKEVVVVSEYVDSWRWIPTFDIPRYDGVGSWNGDPRGRWEGDTLVVESTGFNDSTWFDLAGNFHSEDLKLTERFTRTAADTISYEATIEDPKVFTRPWKIKLPFYRQRGMTRILENECYMYADEAGKGVHDAPPGSSAVK